jgi:DNA-binding LytR/AlgR family response regulator
MSPVKRVGVVGGGDECLKLRIEISDELAEDEVIIRCSRIDENVQKLQSYVANLSSPKIVFYKGQQEFFLQLEEILFFETESERVFAHTEKDAYRVKFKLYELEELLPRSFARASKGTIVNTSRIFSINRQLTSSSQVRFTNTHKQIYISRHYFNMLKDKMNERSV